MQRRFPGRKAEVRELRLLRSSLSIVETDRVSMSSDVSNVRADVERMRRRSSDLGRAEAIPCTHTDMDVNACEGPFGCFVRPANGIPAPLAKMSRDATFRRLGTVPRTPTDEDRTEAIRKLLSGLKNGSDAHDLAASVFDLHPKHNTFPGEVFMEVAADALELAGVSRGEAIPYQGLRETFLSECEFRGRENGRIQYAILATGAMRAGIEPDLLDEVYWWRSDDFWRYGLFAAVGLIRAAAARRGIPISRLAEQLAERHGVQPL